MIVVLDECTPFNVDKEYTAASMHRSHRWALRSLEEFTRTDTGKQALYGIIQGGVYEGTWDIYIFNIEILSCTRYNLNSYLFLLDLRDVSADFMNKTPFFGIAIGGSLGATKENMHHIVKYTRSKIREDKPIHLLGIGGIRDIFHGSVYS